MNRTGILYALVSAALFGATTPAAKFQLGEIDPVLLAGLLYCGAGFGIAILRRIVPRRLVAETAAPLTQREAPWLAGAVLFGGILGPSLMMWGVAHTEATTASLLLTLEGVATAAIAWFVFREGFDRRILFGMACLVAGAAVLAWSGTPTFDGVTGPLAIVGACLAWGIDNNLTRKVSLADPFQIVELKGLVAGPFNVVLALLAGASLPAPSFVALAAVTGFLGYGVSLALYVVALRDLGAARTSAYFATAPFLGAIVAVVGLGEPVTAGLLAAGILMALGVWLHATEHHEHEHVHQPMTHEHLHVHDAHHQHAHRSQDPPGEPHTHSHVHGQIKHSHPHTPDMHHTHRH